MQGGFAALFIVFPQPSADALDELHGPAAVVEVLGRFLGAEPLALVARLVLVPQVALGLHALVAAPLAALEVELEARERGEQEGAQLAARLVRLTERVMAQDLLEEKGLSVTLINPRWIKLLDGVSSRQKSVELPDEALMRLPK